MRIQSALVALAASLVAAVPPLEIKGNEFYNTKTGDKFQIVGVAYQPGGSAGFTETSPDPLSDPEACLRDAALMQVMGVNAIRVYNLNPNKNHDQCASIFNAAGMYMILDVNSPLVGQALDSGKPWETYYAAYLNHTFAVVEAFANYPNTLLFFSGNEVINDLPSAKFVPQYLRAVTRDLKNYIKNNLKRQIPVGYSAADVRDVLWDTWNYLQCSVDGKSDDKTRADVFALNSYSWCSIKATYESSTFNKLTDGFSKSSIPVFFSEYGCIEPPTRYWNETRAMYSDKMTPVFSGGVVYEWTLEANNYGLVSINGSTLNILGDYNRLKSAWATIDWKSVQSQKAAKKDITPPKCGKSLLTETGFDSNFTAPAPPPGAQKLIDDGISPKPSGKIVKISDYNVKMAVKDTEGKVVTGLKVIPLGDDEFNMAGSNKLDTGKSDPGSGSSGNSTDKGDDKEDSGAALHTPMMLAAVVPLVAMLFV
ncbi:glycoside hydrolase family 72 protein [Pochonia chlamydosporia 170]|uniref:1,3-beta-glucanosyltransferase n=1 Tax=Pochonia chlamydosporia 170 TaxID=1380566 RepID=A0A179G5V7_METCM|nr:glycoside hydrolase family 72 protein [Pochonia chlamydosporia 170]OAQ73207.1 glycoside hydrolase family 72 protein [Pochonia chlamydosporia 170]